MTENLSSAELEKLAEDHHASRNEAFDDYFPECDALSPDNIKVFHQDQHDDRIQAATQAAGVIPLAWGAAFAALLVGHWIKREFTP
jgi:hypothetical protein